MSSDRSDERHRSRGASLLGGALAVSVCTLASRVLGLLRDVACAAVFGAGVVFDAFLFAFTIPNLFRTLFGEGALSSAFVPAVSKTLETEPEAAPGLIGSVYGFFLVVLAAITLAGSALALGLDVALSPSFRTSLFLKLLAILLPYMLFICIVALLSGALNATGHYLAPATAPVLFNLFWLAGVFLVSPLFGDGVEERIFGLAVTITLSGMAQIALLAGPLARRSLIPRFVCAPGDPRLKEVIGAMVPMVFGLALLQINTLADRLVAWFMIPDDGAISALFLANRLYQFPLALTALALAAPLLPLLSRLVVRQRHDRAVEVLRHSLGATLFLSLPAGVGLIVLADPVIALFFGRGRFDAAAVERTAAVLAVLSCGLWATSCSVLATRAFYAHGDTRTPARVAALAVAANLVLDLALVIPLAEVGLALATALSSVLNVAILSRSLARTMPGVFTRELGLSGLRSLVLALIMGAGILLGTRQIASPLAAVLCGVAGGGTLYLVLAVLFGRRELRQLARLRAPIPDQEEVPTP